MRIIVFCLFLIPTVSCANERWFAIDAGEVRITTNECPHNPKLKAGYIISKHGGIVDGCWVFSSEVIFSPNGADYLIRKPWEETYPVIDGSERKAPKKIRPDNSKEIVVRARGNTTWT